MEYDRFDLMRLREQVEYKRALERRKVTLGNRKRELSSEESRLAVLRRKEDADVEKWEGSSLAAFFYGVVGKREERQEKENVEAYEAAVKHDAIKAELASVETDLDKVNKELEQLKGCEWEYKKAVDEKAAALAAEGQDNGILELQQEQAKIKEQYRELKEAMAAGERTMRQTRAVKQLLSEAKNWGRWDMAGGGLFSTMMKHDKLKEAQVNMEQLQISLGRFRTELKDVDIEAELSWRISEFECVADYIFDCWLIDWEIQDKIQDARDRISDLESQIAVMSKRLRQVDRELDEKSMRLKEEWQKKIVEA